LVRLLREQRCARGQRGEQRRARRELLARGGGVLAQRAAAPELRGLRDLLLGLAQAREVAQPRAVALRPDERFPGLAPLGRLLVQIAEQLAHREAPVLVDLVVAVVSVGAGLAEGAEQLARA